VKPRNRQRFHNRHSAIAGVCAWGDANKDANLNAFAVIGCPDYGIADMSFSVVRVVHVFFVLFTV
jgi:hypothetical protein